MSKARETCDGCSTIAWHVWEYPKDRWYQTEKINTDLSLSPIQPKRMCFFVILVSFFLVYCVGHENSIRLLIRLLISISWTYTELDVTKFRRRPSQTFTMFAAPKYMKAGSIAMTASEFRKICKQFPCNYESRSQIFEEFITALNPSNHAHFCDRSPRTRSYNVCIFFLRHNKCNALLCIIPVCVTYPFPLFRN